MQFSYIIEFIFKVFSTLGIEKCLKSLILSRKLFQCSECDWCVVCDGIKTTTPTLLVCCFTHKPNLLHWVIYSTDLIIDWYYYSLSWPWPGATRGTSPGRRPPKRTRGRGRRPTTRKPTRGWPRRQEWQGEIYQAVDMLLGIKSSLV